MNPWEWRMMNWIEVFVGDHVQESGCMRGLLQTPTDWKNPVELKYWAWCKVEMFQDTEWMDWVKRYIRLDLLFIVRVEFRIQKKKKEIGCWWISNVVSSSSFSSSDPDHGFKFKKSTLHSACFSSGELNQEPVSSQNDDQFRSLSLLMPHSSKAPLLKKEPNRREFNFWDLSYHSMEPLLSQIIAHLI